jgi:hypothetical protein
VKQYRLEAEAAVEFDIESAFSWDEAEEPGLDRSFSISFVWSTDEFWRIRLDMRNNAPVFDAG